ncbi:MAG: hypothetical protein R8J84_03140 [Mariprofundales bacterium]
MSSESKPDTELQAQEADPLSPAPTIEEALEPVAEVGDEVGTEAIPPSDSVTEHTAVARPYSAILWLLSLLLVAIAGVSLIPNPLQPRMDALWHGGMQKLMATVKPAAQNAETDSPSLAVPPSPSAIKMMPKSEDLVPPTASTAPQASVPEQVVPESAALSAPVVTPSQPAAEIVVAREVEAERATPVSAPADATALQQMRKAISSLGGELAQMSRHQQQLGAQQVAIGRIALRQRLALLQSPAVHLPQLTAAWQEIALLPGLTPEQRARAEKLLAAAQLLLHQQRQWQQAARQLSDALATVSSDSSQVPITLSGLLHRPDNRWLNWLDAQFVLYRLPTADDQLRQRLRGHLLALANRLDLEQWPSEKAWQQQRQQLARMLPDDPRRQQLPQSFVTMAQQLAQLRRQAVAWLEEVR